MSRTPDRHTDRLERTRAAPLRRVGMATALATALVLGTVGPSLAATPTPAPATATAPKPAPVVAPRSASETAGLLAVAEARKVIGRPYRWGATGPKAFDCSGLTSFVWKKAGVTIPRTSREQFAKLPRVKAANLRPGDLVYFSSPYSHVAIYIGNGQMIETSSSRGVVRIAPIAGRRPAGYVRPHVPEPPRTAIPKP